MLKKTQSTVEKPVFSPRKGKFRSKIFDFDSTISWEFRRVETPSASKMKKNITGIRSSNFETKCSVFGSIIQFAVIELRSKIKTRPHS